MSQVLNQPRAETVLSELGIDVIVATTHQNVFYLTGYIGFGQRLMPATQVYALARADALVEPVLVAPISDLDMHAQFPARLAKIRPYGRFFAEQSTDGSLAGEHALYDELMQLELAGGAGDALLEELTALPPGSRIALDERGVSTAVRDTVIARFGDRVVDGSHILDRIRMVKTPEEVRRLEVAAVTTEQAYQAALEAARPGMSEAELARIFDCKTVEQGATPYFTVIAFGERGALPNAIPSEDRMLRRGDQIRFDIGCRAEMYSSDIARTAVLGDPSAKIADYYDAILAGEEQMLEVMKPGITAGEVFDVAVERVRESGIPHYRRHHVGHGVGLDTYDQPLLGPGVATVLEPGMVFEIETPYYELGFGGLQVEDTVVITEEGCRVLTRTPRELVIVA